MGGRDMDSKELRFNNLKKEGEVANNNRKPIIGIVGRPWTSNDENIIGISENLRRAVIQNGGIPIIILPSKNMVYSGNREPELLNEDKEILQAQIKLCDGILMGGGERIYNYNKYICKVAMDNDIPLLGICMGMQIICNYNNDNKNIRIRKHSTIKSTNKVCKHNVTLISNSLLYDIIKKNKITVISNHSYAVPNSGDCTVSAKCR